MATDVWVLRTFIIGAEHRNIGRKMVKVQSTKTSVDKMVKTKIGAAHRNFLRFGAMHLDFDDIFMATDVWILRTFITGAKRRKIGRKMVKVQSTVTIT